MSAGFGKQADPWAWGENYGQDAPQNADSNNCWVQRQVPTPQNYNYQHFSKDGQQQNIPQQGIRAPHHPAGADYFGSDDLRMNSQMNQNSVENNYGGDHQNPGRGWGHHQAPPLPPLYHQMPVFANEMINNNSVITSVSSTEVENREIAPPDSKPPKIVPANYNQPPQQEDYSGRQNFQPSPPTAHFSQFVPKQPPPLNNNSASGHHVNKLPPSSFVPANTSSPLGQYPPSSGMVGPLPPPPIPQQVQDKIILPPVSNSEPKIPAPIFHQNTPMYLPPGPQPFGNSEVSHRSTPPPKNRASPLSNNNPPYQNLPQWGLSPAYPPSVATLPDSENVPPPGGYPGQNRQTGLRRSSSPGNAALQPVPPPSHNIPDNQERIPENRERLDNTEDVRQQLGTLSLNQQAESNDVQQHCSVDRNQYLETGQLSNLNNMAAGSANIEITDEGDAPPPGLHRLVTGQGCENQEQLVENQMSSFSQPEPSAHHDSTRHSTPLSSIEEPDRGGNSEAEVEVTSRRREGPRLVPGQSVGEEPPPPREVPGQDQPLHNRVVLGQMGGRQDLPQQQDNSSTRGDIGRERERDRDSDRMERMVVGEMRSKQPQNSSSAQDDYNRQQHRGRPRHRRESSYEEEERDYSTDREKRHEDYRRRDERPRRRREHRSPEYRSDEEYDERRGYSRRERRSHERDYSPEYYRDYYRDRRPRRHMDHYSREYDDYYYRENRSRPSSRTGSDYRRSNVDYQQRHPWQPFYPDSTISSGTYMDYNMSQRALKDYCEAFRRTDPINYRIWYNQQILRYNVTQPASYSNDRASVHSGQSSSDQRQNVPTPQDMTHTDGVAPVDDTGVEDFTPRLYPAPHIRGKLDSQGRLVIVNPNDPMDGQRPSVQICKVNRTCWDPDIAEFLECPGPFISGVTHRNTVLQYLKKMSERSTGDSEKLLYDLVHLTVKGNGVVNGSDVAELLMDSYKLSSQEDKESNFDNDLPQISETEIISRFRGLLQQGNKTEALEWAMDHKVWGHALFLASKMDDRTHKAVMLRFANSIPHNDPLQTLYQLMSSNVPQASTYCADNNWSDWRPHLAMILSNPTANTELDRKAIITLGDSLGAGDRIFASHFCYLTAQVRFSSFKPGAKLVLLGSSTNQEFHKFATCRAIMLSLCYEYGLKLYNPLNSVPTFQTYKLLLATRLIDHDRNQSALQYCELLAREMSQPCHYDAATAVTVIDIAMRLKTFDPQVALSSDPDKEPEWLTSLKQVHEHAPVRKDDDERNSLSRGVSNSTVSEIGMDVHHDNPPYRQVADPGSGYVDNQAAHQDYPTADMPQNMFIPGQVQPGGMQPPEMLLIDNQQQHYQQQPPYLQPEQPHTNEFNGYQSEPRIDVGGGGQKLWGNGNVASLEPARQQVEQQHQPQVTAKPGFNYYKTSEEQLKDEVTATVEKAPKDGKDESKSKETKKPVKNKKNEDPASGWFGGIWEKFRPKNQMRLPDDKNPSIVWDQEQKRWVNLEGDDEDKPEVKAPPRASELLPTSQMSTTNLPPESSAVLSTAPPGVNKYKLQKGRQKLRYVDVMGGTPRATQGSNQLDGLIPVMPTMPANTNLFVPTPVESSENAPVDFITPGNIVVSDNRQEPNKEVKPQDQVPMMYNPVGFTT